MYEKIKKHFAVEQIYKDSDGWWVILNDGYEFFGCVSIHEYTLTRCWSALKSITKIA
jgi:hypothetical protein